MGIKKWATEMLLRPVDRFSKRWEERDEQWLRENPDALERVRAEHAAFLKDTDAMRQRLEVLREQNKSKPRNETVSRFWRRFVYAPYLRITRRQIDALHKDQDREEAEMGNSPSLERSRFEAAKLDREQAEAELAQRSRLDL